MKRNKEKLGKVINLFHKEKKLFDFHLHFRAYKKIFNILSKSKKKKAKMKKKYCYWREQKIKISKLHLMLKQKCKNSILC